MPERKEWTVMIYLAGDNNLSEEMVYALKEMKLAGVNANSQVNIIAQFDPNEQGVKTRRFNINSTGQSRGALLGDLNRVTDVLGFLNETNTGDPETAADFIFFGMEKFPARHYMVVLSGHGSGIDEGFLLQDENPQDSLDIKELAAIFSRLKEKLAAKGLSGELGEENKIEILGMDSCLMSAAEVCYQLRDHVKYVIGPQGFESNTGWPYQLILSKLIKQETIKAKDLAIGIVNDYVAYYFDYVMAGRSVDLSVCDLNQSELLEQAVKNLVQKLKAGLLSQTIRDAIVLSHWEAQGYKFDQFADLYDFCGLLLTRCNEASGAAEDIRGACGEVMKAVQGDAPEDPRFVLHSCTSGPAFQHSHGVSIYFPWESITKDYDKLDFVMKTSWDEFLREYILRTRRPQKEEVRQFELDVDSPTKSKGPDKLGTMKNGPRTWMLSQCLIDSVNALLDGEVNVGGDKAADAESH